MEKNGEYLRVDHQLRNRKREISYGLFSSREAIRSQRRPDGRIVWKQNINKAKA